MAVEQYDHRWCENCNKEAWFLVKVKVHRGHAAHMENTVSEWVTENWCLVCLQEGRNG